MYFFFNDTATTEIYTLSLHDALPILQVTDGRLTVGNAAGASNNKLNRIEIKQLAAAPTVRAVTGYGPGGLAARRSEEHTSELQSRQYLVCRLLLEKKYSRICHCCSTP